MKPNEPPAPSPFEQRTDATMLLLLARIHALELVVQMIAEECGLDAKLVSAAQERLTSVAHQLTLEKVEAINPGLSAALDRRPGIPDLDEELLKKLRLKLRE
jgi:hypothetical protein